MDKNTVYMYLMAMCSIIFEWTKIILVENKVPKINVAMRTKAICFNYIMVAATIIKHAGQKIIQFFSSPIEYDILKI